MQIITRSLHNSDLYPGIAAHFGKNHKQMEKQFSRIFENKTSDKAYEEMVESTTFGLPSRKEEGKAIRYDTDGEGYKSRFTNVVWGLAYGVTREEVEDNQYESKGKMRARNLAYSMGQAKEMIHASLFNNGFTNSAPYLMGDGQPFFSTAHPTLAGNKANRPAVDSDLSEASLEDALIDVRLTTNSRGLKMQFRATDLILPPQLEYVGIRLLKSEKQSGTANNDVNAVRTNGAVRNGAMVWDYLTDPDAWFLKVDIGGEGLVTFQRRALELDQDNDFDTENAKFKATERYVQGVGDWRCIRANGGH